MNAFTALWGGFRRQADFSLPNYCLSMSAKIVNLKSLKSGHMQVE